MKARSRRQARRVRDDHGLHPGHRPRHHLEPGDRLRRAHGGGGHGAGGVSAALPAVGLGRARPGRHLVDDRRGLPRRDRAGGDRPRGAGGDRHHQPARDDAGLGPRHRRAARPGDRLAGPPHQRALRRAGGGRARADGHRAHRAAARPLLLRHQAEVAARHPRGRARAGAAGRPAVRHRRQLADLEADRRQGACDRRDERRADPALRHPRGRLGPGHLRAPRRADGDAAGGARLGGRLRDGARRPLRPRGADPRRRRRPAGGDRRPGLLRARDAEGDLRHRLLRGAQHRRDRRSRAATGC